MYTLRIIEEFRADEKAPWQQEIINIELGARYSLFKGFHPMILKAQDNFKEVDVKEKIMAVIHSGNKEDINIWKNDNLMHRDYFVLTENGSTFERIKNA